MGPRLEDQTAFLADVPCPWQDTYVTSAIVAFVLSPAISFGGQPARTCLQLGLGSRPPGVNEVRLGADITLHDFRGTQCR